MENYLEISMVLVILTLNISTEKKTFIFNFSAEIVQLLMSMQVDRINQVQLQWSSNYQNPNSREYRLLLDEANKAVIYIFI